MKTQAYIAKKLKVSQPFINYVLNGKRPVSWPLAERLADLYPERDIKAWKNATPEEIKETLFAALPHNPPKTKEEMS